MHIAVTHSNADFDALASLVGVTMLYKNTIGLIPRQLQPSVQQFLSLHRDIFHLQPAKEAKLKDVSRLIIVDTNNWRRLEDGLVIKDMDIHETILWDHHMNGTDIEANISRHCEMGATITLIVQEIMQRDIAFTPMHGTLFMLGLYDDTGCLTYPTTRSEDARAAAYLLENGADLNIVNAFLTDYFDAIQQRLLTQMLDHAQRINANGIKIGLAHLHLENSVNMLSQVVVKFRELSGLDVAIGLFSFYDKTFVIGRSILPAFNIGKIIRAIGGGGHAGAASAVVNSIEPDRLYSILIDHINNADTDNLMVGAVMHKPKEIIDARLKIEDAAAIFSKTNERFLVVFEDDRYIGVVTKAQIDSAILKRQARSPVKTLTMRDMPRLKTDQSLREAATILMDNDLGALAVFEQENFFGIVTRKDVMLHLYEL